MTSPTGPQRSLGRSYERAIPGVLIERSADGLRITRPWSKAAGYASLAWTAIWFGIVAFFTSLGQQPTQVHTLLALPGIAMAYVALTRFVNSTLIEVTSSTITLCHTPLPWPGKRRFSTRDISALHMEIRRIHAKGHSVDEAWILVERTNGKKARLVKGLEMSAPQMSGIAAVLNEHLGVPLSSD